MLPFTTLIWLIPVAIALHEFEKWNIIHWYHRNFVDLPNKASTTTRTFLVFMTVLGFVWTVLALIPNDPKTAYIISPLAAVLTLNASHDPNNSSG